MADSRDDQEITVYEIARNLRDFRSDQQLAMNAIRSDTQTAISKIEGGLHDLRSAINEAPYVHTLQFEEVRKNQGERIGDLEATVRKVNQMAWAAILSVAAGIATTIMAVLIGTAR